MRYMMTKEKWETYPDTKSTSAFTVHEAANQIRTSPFKLPLDKPILKKKIPFLLSK
jgi:hypothetical protein